MAVYQAAHQQVIAVPRRRQGVHQRARRGASRVGLILGAILVVFLLGLFYLTQAIGTATAGYDTDRLTADGAGLDRQLSTQQGEIAAFGSEQNVIQAAQAAGLVDLGDGQPLRVAGR
ncbi:MAG TPA: hypothetical protein VN771_05630 [Candidatus Baltobacteraceae bacterium]|nr:hypothetical protein [Candidatus Baltobacteraceae bacterium]